MQKIQCRFLSSCFGSIATNLLINAIQKIEPMSKAITSKDITERFIQIVNENILNYSDELQIIEVLFKKYKPMTIADYAKLKGKEYNSIKFLVNNFKLPFIEIAENKLILTGLT